MVKRMMAGLAISLGAGLALTVTTRNGRKGPWRLAKDTGTLTPVTIRVHPVGVRTEAASAELVRTSDNVAATASQAVFVESEEVALTSAPARSAELAEIRVMIDALDQRGTDMMTTVNQRIDDLQNHLPRFIDVKVTSRIREVEERLRMEFQDEQCRTLDAFLKTLDEKILPRITVIEDTVESHGIEISQMRKRIEKTDETLDRVLLRIEKAVDSITVPYNGHGNSHVMEIHQKAVA
jgi:hypothetical protein